MAFVIKVSLAVLVGFVLVGAMLGSKHDGHQATGAATVSTVAKEARPTPDIQLLNFNCSHTYGFTTVEGEIRNLTNSPISNLVVVASHSSSDGQFIKSDTALIEYNPIMPGQTSPFKSISTHNPMMSKCKVGFKLLFGGAVRVKE
jgi:hypothetical protein